MIHGMEPLGALVVAAAVTTAAILVLRPLAERVGLVDHPNERKQHSGQIPLIGGLAVFLGMATSALFYPHGMGNFSLDLLAASAALVVTGALDDRFDLTVRLRLLIQACVVLIMIAASGLYIDKLGVYFGHELALGWIGIPVTVVAVVGLVNAFNMMDGIDGLAGSLGLVSIGAIVLFDGVGLLEGPTLLLVLLGAALIPYIVFNLGLVGKRHKIFMGDAGSMVLGYLVAWMLIYSSQDTRSHLAPTDVLWCVAVPVIDTLAVMARRMRQGRSPFSPDSGHVHHILLHNGLGQRQTLLMLIGIAAALAVLGGVLQSLSPAISLAAFAALCISYAGFCLRPRKARVETAALPSTVVPMRHCRRWHERRSLVAKGVHARSSEPANRPAVQQVQARAEIRIN
jgi:UDP-GlcNAc:undecaprenyl-phosphate GlcNAc-1-phosphate transferase